MKKFRWFLFEFVVIFIGITASFAFEEWRSSRNNDKTVRKLMQESLQDLEDLDRAWGGYYDSVINRRVADYITLATGEAALPDSVVVNALDLQGRRFNVTSFYSTIILSENENRLLIDNEELLGEIRILEIFIKYHNDQQALIDEYYNEYVYPVVVRYDVHKDLAAEVDTIDFRPESRNSKIPQMLVDPEFRRNIMTPYKAIVTREDAYMQIKDILADIRKLLKAELSE